MPLYYLIWPVWEAEVEAPVNLLKQQHVLHMNQAVNKEGVNINREEKTWMVLAIKHNYTKHSGDIPWMKLWSLTRDGRKHHIQ